MTKYIFIIGCIFIISFLLLTPVGDLAPYGKTKHGFSLTRIDPHDDMAYYVKVKSLFFDGNLYFKDERLRPDLLAWQTRKGNPVLPVATPIGPSLLWSPFVAIAHIVTIALNEYAGSNIATDGYSIIYIAFTCIGSSLYAFLSLLISYFLLIRFFSPPVSALSVITVFFGNTLFYNSFNRMLMAHAPEAFTVALAIFLFVKARERDGVFDYALLGLSFGLMGLVRFENLILFSIMPAFDLLHSVFACYREKAWTACLVKIRNYTVAFATALTVFSLQLVHFYIQTGEIVPAFLKHLGATIATRDINLYELLFGQTRNITWGQPIVILGAVGTLLMVVRERFLGITMVLCVAAAIIWLVWRPHVYWFGMDYGIRHLIKISLPLSFGYAALISTFAFRFKAIVFSVLSILVVSWEYIKYLQASITSVLDERFLILAGSNIHSLVVDNFPEIFFGRKGSFINLMFNYEASLWNGISMDRVLMFYGLPASIIILTTLYCFLSLFLWRRFYRKRIIIKLVVIACCSFFVFLSIGGVVFSKSLVPQPVSETITNDRKSILGGKEVFFEIDIGTNAARQYLRAGWSVDEGPYPKLDFPSFAWALGESADLTFEYQGQPQDCALIFRALSFSLDQVIRIEVNGFFAGALALLPKWNTCAVAVPAHVLKSSSNKITFVFRKSLEKNSKNDNRALAVAFDWVAIYKLK